MVTSSLYILIANFLLFAAVLKGFSNQRFGAKTASLIVVLLPFVIAKLVLLIVYSGLNLPWLQAFVWADVVLVALQLAVAFIIFKILDREDDWLSPTWLIGATVGALLLYGAVPYLVSILFI